MALETLKGVTEIGGFEVHEYCYDQEEAYPSFVQLDQQDNTITFKIQNGPIKENGVNGCQVDTLIHAARHIIHELNKKYPCAENVSANTYLRHALECLEKRTADREARGVEGTSHR